MRRAACLKALKLGGRFNCAKPVTFVVPPPQAAARTTRGKSSSSGRLNVFTNQPSSRRCSTCSAARVTQPKRSYKGLLGTVARRRKAICAESDPGQKGNQ